METVVVERALCFMQICFVEVLLEIIIMSIFTWVVSLQGGYAYPLISVLTNVLRWLLVTTLVWELSRACNEVQTFDGRTSRTRLLHPCVIGFWRFSMVAQSVWNFIMMVQTDEHDGWASYTVAALTAMNTPICFLALCLHVAPPGPEGPRITVKTFQHHGEVRTDSSLQFGTSCNICFSDLEEGQLIGQLPCGHAFHEQCILEWLAQRKGCPMRCVMPKDHKRVVSAVRRRAAGRAAEPAAALPSPALVPDAPGS
mmetsp:Transcript_42194/g.117493  ORF Transcript_42194/g.117493 Transcript_42194/m.117493 type:complete len:255 (-) Transcript_42194:140-904(-)